MEKNPGLAHKVGADITPEQADSRAELATTASDETLDPAFTPSITPRQNFNKRNLKKKGGGAAKYPAKRKPSVTPRSSRPS
jgi:hypothetical protein